jgi:cyclase
MELNPTTKFITRREMLRTAAALTGGALVARFCPGMPVYAAIPAFPQKKTAADQVAAMRAQFGNMPIQTQKLTDSVTLLSGPGGNVIVLNGKDGKLLGDTFVKPAWPHLKEALDTIGKAPIKTAIDTHWHFDHSDNNASLRAAGATLFAHENTKKRMSETHTLAVLNLTFPPSPAAALPQQTFPQSHKIMMNGETVALVHIPPAHTDSDIYIHFEKANVLQADNNTKIVPGHGPLGDKADLMRYRSMLVTVRERLQKLKSSGKTVKEAIAAKPLDDLDPVWGKGLFNSDTFIQIAYPAL